jgi:hypothetical protein
MPFDLATAKPAAAPKSGGFDLSSAKPVDAVPEDKGTLETIGAALGKATGDTVLGAQKLVGMGVKKLGGVGSEPKLSDLIVGKKQNMVERAGQWLIDDADQGKAKLAAENQPFKDANPITSGVAEVGGQVLTTLPVGGLLAKGMSAAAPAVVKLAPSAAPAFNALTRAVGTSGMTTGVKVAPGILPAAQNLATRAVGGGITGATSSALLDPSSADTGFMIGAGLPVVAQGAGKVANSLGKVLRGPEVAPEMQAAIKSAVDAGYVIPPTQAKPTLINRLMEGLAGKITTAQNASAKNAGVTNALSAKALGLTDDVKLTPEVLADIRAKAGSAYKAIGDELPIRPAQAADSLTNRPAVEAIDPKKMVFDLRKARNEADAWFKSYGRTADPDSLAKAKAAKSAAQELESTLENYAKSMGREDLIPEMAKARQLIAKTYSVENALNSTTGNVDAKKLAQQLAKGKPLSGELKQAAEFAARFPKAAQTVEGMGSLPQTSPLDWAASGAIGAATSNPLALLGVAARPAARGLALSGPVQRGLSGSQTPNKLVQLLSSPEGQQLLYRSAPPLVTSR